jgi:phage shock protein C
MERRLYRSNTNKILGGVCGGVAEYFRIDPIIVRAVWVLLLFTHVLGAPAALLYIVGWIVLPSKTTVFSACEESKPTPSPAQVEMSSRNKSLFAGIVILLIGAAALIGTVTPRMPIQLAFAFALIMLGGLIMSGVFSNGYNAGTGGK